MDGFKCGDEAPNPDEDALFEWAVGSSARDVSSLGGVSFPANTQQCYKGVKVFKEMQDLVHYWKTLSKAWCVYCATGSADHMNEPGLSIVLKKCGICNLRSLRDTLSLFHTQDLDELKEDETLKSQANKLQRDRFDAISAQVTKWKKKRENALTNYAIS